MSSEEYCKLSDYAKKFGVTYRTAFNHYKEGKFEGAKKTAKNRIIIPKRYINASVSNNVVIYAAVNSRKENDILNERLDRLTMYCNAKGYKVEKVVKEINNVSDGQTLEENRPKLYNLIKDNNIKHIVIDNKSQVSYVGYEYLKAALQAEAREIETMNDTVYKEDDYKQSIVDFVYDVYKECSDMKITKQQIKNKLDELDENDDNANKNK